MNKIESSNPKISLINGIDTQPNPSSKNMLEITESGDNIHIEKNQSTTTTTPIILSNETIERLPDGSIMDP